MLLFVAIVAVALIRSSLGFDNCFVHADAKLCKSDNAFDGIPINAEELDTFCQEFQSSLRCIIDEYKKCSESKNVEDFLEQVLRYAERSCNTDSEIYKVISSNLQCIGSIDLEEEKACASNETKEVLLQHKEDLDERSISEDCQYGVLDAICDGAEVGEKCGEDVGFAVMDVSININYNIFHCPTDVIEKMPEVLLAVLIEREIANAFSNEIKKK